VAVFSRALARRGSSTPDPAKRVLIPYQLVKLDDLNPLVRNSNTTTDAQEQKIGPSAWMKIGNTWHVWIEGIQGTGYPVNNAMTAMMKATTTSLQGPYTFSPATTRIRDASDTTTWEYYEHSFADIVLSRGNLIAMYHGGNNNGPQHMGIDITGNITDGTTGWIADTRNPVIVCGTTGAWDDRQVANDFKLVRYKNQPGNPFTGKLWAAYRGRQAGTIADGLTGRATVSPDYRYFIKDPPATAGQVIFSAPSWNAGGRTSGTPVLDDGGRAHMWYPGGFAGIGKSYSDDDGYTWVDENSGNRVASPSGVTGTADYNGTGDVVQTIWDGDVAFIFFGTENVVNFATNNPMRGQSGAIVPFPKVSPLRLGKFYLASARTDITSTSLLSQTTFSIMGRFRAYRTKRNGTPRVIYWEEPTGGGAVGNKQVNVVIDANGGANAGKLNVLCRTPTAFFNMFSTAVVDDALWHTFLFRRISTSSAEFYVDGVLQTSDAVTNPGTDATATLKSVGNWNPSTSESGDGRFNGTISDLGTVTGYAATATEATAWINNRTTLGGGTVVFDLTANGTTGESGNVVTVEASGY
jgi:hypothetical protein